MTSAVESWRTLERQETALAWLRAWAGVGAGEVVAAPRFRVTTERASRVGKGAGGGGGGGGVGVGVHDGGGGEWGGVGGAGVGGGREAGLGGGEGGGGGGGTLIQGDDAAGVAGEEGVEEDRLVGEEEDGD